MADEVKNFDQFYAAVARALADPQARAATRAVYRERLFGDLADGRAAERTAAMLAALIAPAAAISPLPSRRVLP